MTWLLLFCFILLPFHIFGENPDAYFWAQKNISFHDFMSWQSNFWQKKLSDEELPKTVFCCFPSLSRDTRFGCVCPFQSDRLCYLNL